ncbi:MAG: N-acetyltransferase [Bauldia sp.]
MIHFATEAPAEAGAREALLDRVMGRARFLKPSEKLRAGRTPARGLALVAREDDGRLVGSVRLWNVDAGGRPALLLGPLAVDQTAQGEGVGAGLMRLAIARAGMIGHRAIVLVGAPEYYARFGFTADKTSGLLMPGPVDRLRFLSLELDDGALDGAEGRISATGAMAPTAMAA